MTKSGKAQADWNSIVGDDPRGYFDWEKELIKTASYQNYDVSVTGGSDKTSFFASFGYTKENGRVDANDLSRIGGRLNVNQKLFTHPTRNWFNNVELTSNVAFSATEKNGFNDTQNNGPNYFLLVRNLMYDQWWPKDLDGNWVMAYRTYGRNALYYDQFRENLSKMNRLTINETLRIDLWEDLSFKSIFGYDETRVDDYAWRASTHFDAPGSGSVTNNLSKILSMISTNTLSYDKTFAGKHNLSLLLGFESQKNKTDYVGANGTNLPTLNSKTIATAGTKTSTAYYYGHNMLSVFSRLEYNYDNRYFVGGSFRRDGSSKLSAEARWGNFWSVSGSWKVKNEEFLRDNKTISNLRLKASYGVNGTLPTPNYGHIPLYDFGQNYNNKPGGYVSTIADRNLSWETSYTYNIGFELGLFESRLNLNMDYYSRDSRNLLQKVPISNVTGFASILANVGEMNNSGLEIELSGDIIRSKKVQWYMNINASTLKSRVTHLYEGADIIYYDPTGGDNQAKFVFREGTSPKSFYGKEWAGVDPANGEPMWFINNPSYKGTVYKEIDGRPVTNQWKNATETIYASADPKLFGGINTNVKWNGFALDLNFVYSLGGTAYNAFEKYMNDDGYFTSRTRGKKAMDYWKQPGDVTQAPRLGLDAANIFNSHNSRYAYKNNYLRLKNIGLSYYLPKEVLEQMGLASLRVYFTGANLLTFASQKGFDPEVNAYGATSWQMPLGKTYVFGLELSF